MLYHSRLQVRSIFARALAKHAYLGIWIMQRKPIKRSAMASVILALAFMLAVVSPVLAALNPQGATVDGGTATTVSTAGVIRIDFTVEKNGEWRFQ